MTIKQSSTNMAKNIFLILCIFLSFKLSAQNGRSETVSFLMDEFSSNLLKTNDDFYFSGNHDYYLINKSPLAHFSEYRSIYSADPNDIITYRVLYNPPRPYGWEGVSEKQWKNLSGKLFQKRTSPILIFPTRFMALCLLNGLQIRFL